MQLKFIPYTFNSPDVKFPVIRVQVAITDSGVEIGFTTLFFNKEIREEEIDIEAIGQKLKTLFQADEFSVENDAALRCKELYWTRCIP